jgi:hypothetical protein
MVLSYICAGSKQKHMKKITLLFFQVVFMLNCCTQSSHVTEQFKSKPTSQVKKELESFIESHNWHYTDAEKRPVIAATPEELAWLKSAWARAVTGDKKYADLTAAILLGYAHRYLNYPMVSAMTFIAEGGRRLGMDFYNDEMLHKMYVPAFDYCMADSSLLRFGDAVDDSPDNQSVNEQAYAEYKDYRLLASLPDKLTWDMIMAGRKPGKKHEQAHLVSKLIPGASKFTASDQSFVLRSDSLK